MCVCVCVCETTHDVHIKLINKGSSITMLYNSVHVCVCVCVCVCETKTERERELKLENFILQGL